MDIETIGAIFFSGFVAVGFIVIILMLIRLDRKKRSQGYNIRNEECIIIPKEITGSQKKAGLMARNIIERLDWEHITSPRDLVEKLAYSLDFVIKSFKVDEFFSDVEKSESINAKKDVDTTHVNKY